MNLKFPLLAVGVCAIAMSWPASASRLLIDMQGASPSRVMVYVEDATIDVTPIENVMNPQPYLIRQMDLTMIYEAVEQPYWAEYQVELKCPNPSYRGKGAPKRRSGQPTALVTPPSVEFRMAGGAKSTKQAPEILDLPSTDWQSTSSYTMQQAWRVACDGENIRRAKEAVAQDRVVTSSATRAQFAAIGMNGVELVPDGLSMSSLADFTWVNLWSDVPKPKINSGRKSTPAELEALKTQLAQLKEKVESAGQRIQGAAADMKVGLDFTQLAADYRGKRHLSRSESTLIQVWLGKTEEDVVAANGNAAVRQVGRARTLSYGQAFDNRVMWQNLYTGATFTDGGYKSCNVRYSLIPDGAGIPRVADVSVFGEVNGDTRGMQGACTDIMNVPNR